MCQARRFIWLVDALYEHRCQVNILAEAPLLHLFVDDEATGDRDSIDDIMLQESLGSLLENRLTVDGSGNSRQLSAASSFIDVTKSHIFTGRDDVFSFARCQSRLREMQVEPTFDSL